MSVDISRLLNISKSSELFLKGLDADKVLENGQLRGTLKLLSETANHTRRYLAKMKKFRRHNDVEEAILSKLWSGIAEKKKEVSNDLIALCSLTGEDWSNPREWSYRDINKTKRALRSVVYKADHLLSLIKPVVFISYSRKDGRSLDRLKVHLKPLEVENIIELWYDTKLETGEEWAKEIDSVIRKTNIAILLISADFMASDFILEKELPPLLEGANRGTIKVIPVVLKPCRFSRDPVLSKLQAINPPSEPLMSKSKIKQEEIYDHIAEIVEKEARNWFKRQV
jgi:hypothetical protein